MAILTDANRKSLWAAYMSELSAEEASLALTKPDLRAAVNALDQFFSDNAAAVNNAIPQPARSTLTTPQKARLLMFVIRQRYLSGA